MRKLLASLALWSIGVCLLYADELQLPARQVSVDSTYWTQIAPGTDTVQATLAWLDKHSGLRSWPSAHVTVAEKGDRNATTINEQIALVAPTNTILVLDSGSWDINEDISLPTNISLYVASDSVLSGSGTLTFSGTSRLLTEGGFQVFNVGLAVVGLTQVVYPQWWGAHGDNTGDSSPAFQKALDCGAPVEVPPGTYRLGTALVPPTSQMSLVGQQGSGFSQDVLLTCSNGFLATPTTNSGVSSAVIKNLQIQPVTASSGTCMKLYGVINYCLFENLLIRYFEHGFDIQGRGGVNLLKNIQMYTLTGKYFSFQKFNGAYTGSVAYNGWFIAWDFENCMLSGAGTYGVYADKVAFVPAHFYGGSFEVSGATAYNFWHTGLSNKLSQIDFTDCHNDSGNMYSFSATNLNNGAASEKIYVAYNGGVLNCGSFDYKITCEGGVQIALNGVKFSGAPGISYVNPRTCIRSIGGVLGLGAYLDYPSTFSDRDPDNNLITGDIDYPRANVLRRRAGSGVINTTSTLCQISLPASYSRCYSTVQIDAQSDNSTNAYGFLAPIFVTNQIWTLDTPIWSYQAGAGRYLKFELASNGYNRAAISLVATNALTTGLTWTTSFRFPENTIFNYDN